MPELGEIRHATDIGYQGHSLYEFVSCASCGKQRWVRVKELEQGKGLVCRSCGYPNTEYYQQQVNALQIFGAKRASELGKPLAKSRKRDPWYFKHLCSVCGTEVWHMKRDLHRTCSKACGYVVRQCLSGENHPNWKGGRYHHGDGYIVVQILPDSPYYPMAHARGYILEHRLIMAEYLGRCLWDSEVVHHINGRKADNSIENLELLPNDASHLPYIRLQQQVAKLQLEVKLLQWYIRELEQANPDLAEGITLWARVETLQEAPLDDKGEEKVHASRKLEG